MFKRRLTDRDRKQPTRVTLQLRGQDVASFNIGWTDPRFVKADDLLERAREIALSRPCRREDDDKLAIEWDMLRINWGMAPFACDRAGNQIYDAA